MRAVDRKWQGPKVTELAVTAPTKPASRSENEQTPGPATEKVSDRGFTEWAMRESNPRLLPCEGSALAI